MEVMSLPKNAFTSQSYIELFGREEMSINEARGILEYDENYIKIMLKNGCVVIMGKALRVEMFLAKSIMIRGQIEQISFE